MARNLSYLICIILGILIFVDHDTKEKSSLFTFRKFSHELLVRSLCFFQLASTLLYCYLWGIMRYQLALDKYHKYLEEEGGGEEEEAEDEGLPSLR